MNIEQIDTSGRTPYFSIDEVNNVEVEDSDIAKMLKRPDSFLYFGGNEEMFNQWSMGPTIMTRDSEPDEKANAEALLRELKLAEERGIIEPDSWRMERASHWGVGWVEHLTFQVTDGEGNITRVAKWMTLWRDMLQEYPIADNELSGKYAVEKALEIINEVLKWGTRRNEVDWDKVHAHEDAIGAIFTEIDDYPDDNRWCQKEIWAAAEKFGFLTKDEED
jgi:hypothetical protein